MKNDEQRGTSGEPKPREGSRAGTPLGEPNDEPGKPPRRDVGRAGPAVVDSDDEAARIAQQQAATQRGYSADAGKKPTR